eukprot:109299_1
MVTHQFDEKDILQLNQNKQSILTPICVLNCEKTFRFLVQSMSNNTIKQRLMVPEQSKSYPLRRAIENNHFNGVLKQIFFNDKFGLIKYKDHEQKTALNRAWSAKQGKVALLILENISSKQDRLTMIQDTGNDITSLQYALWSGDIQCVQFIFNELEYNKKLKSKLLTYKDSTSKSNFHYAAMGGSVECIQALLTKCEDQKQQNELFAEDNEHQTPGFCAVIEGNASAVDFLLKQMNANEKQTFYSTRNASGFDPIGTLSSSHETNYHTKIAEGLTVSKEQIATLKVLIHHLSHDDIHLYPLWLFSAKNDDIEMAKLILNKLSNNEIQAKLINYQATFWVDHFNSAMHECCQYNTPSFLEWLLSIITDDNPMFTIKNYGPRGMYTPLMICAERGHIKCAKIILNKLKNNRKKLNEVLKIEDANGYNAIEIALKTDTKQKVKFAKLIISYFDENDVESIFLPSVQVGDVKLAQLLWDKTNDDIKLQNKLLTKTDNDKYNAFLAVCRYGEYQSLQWLLSLQNDEKENNEQNEENLTQKHVFNQKTPLLLCVENDIRKKQINKKEKKLTEKQKESYFKCVQLIFSKVSNKSYIVFDTTKQGIDCLMYCCLNGNIQSATLILSQLNDKHKKSLVSCVDSNGYNHFHHAVSGGNLELVKMIYKNLFKKFKKEEEVINDSQPLKISLENGYDDIVEYILFTLIKDNKKQIEYLNQHINTAKTERKFTKSIKLWLLNILNQSKSIEEVKTITNIFKWLSLNDESNLAGITMILSKIPFDNDS